MTKANLKAIGILLVITITFYWKILLTNQFSLLLDFEGVNQAYAWLQFWINTVRQGIWPIWDPFTFSGHSFAGEMQTGAFYPLYFAFLLVPFKQGFFMLEAYHVFYALTHVLGAYFMYLLIRELALSFFAGLVAGVCFSFGGFLARLSGWPHLLGSGIWLPLLVLFLLRATRAQSTQRAFSWAALGGLCLAMSTLAGGLHVVIMQGIVTLSCLTFIALSEQKWRRCSFVLAACFVFALAGGAIQLVPSAEYSGQVIRALGVTSLPATEKIPYAYMGDSIWAQSALGMLLTLTGSPGNGEYVNPYMGVFPLLLAAIGVSTAWGQMWVRYMTGLAIAAFLYALGSQSLLHGLLYAVTPLLWMAREASRFLYLADFAISVLAAFGLDALFRGAHGKSMDSLRTAFKWIAGASAAALVYPVVLGKSDMNPWISLSLLFIICSWILFEFITRGRRANGSRILVLGFILFDLSAFDWSAANRITAASRNADEMARLLSCRGAVDFLRSRPGPFRVQIAVDHAPNIGDLFGIQETMGAGVTIQMDYQKISLHTDLLNTRYTLKAASAKEPGAVYQDSFWKIYENPGAYPRAWLVHETAVEPDKEKLPGRLDTIDLHQTALMEKALLPTLDASPAIETEGAVVRNSRQDRVELDVHAGRRGLVVLSELYYPGWKATINGGQAKILKVDGALRGIVVPPGDSQIVLRYAPTLFFVAAALSIAAFLVGGISYFLVQRDYL